jgi:hypothetical protein
VSAGGTLEPERGADTRLRHALQGALRSFLPATRTTLAASYRFYIDDWGSSGTRRSPRSSRRSSRISTRTCATGCTTRAPPTSTRPPTRPPIPSSSPTYRRRQAERAHHQTIGVKLDVLASLAGIHGQLGQARAEAMFEYIIQSTYFGNAVAAQIAVTFPFRY